MVKEEGNAEGLSKDEGFRKVFFDGVIVNTLNSKTALFFFAFLPQFINPAGGMVAFQISVLGLIFIVPSFIVGSLYAVLSGTIGRPAFHRFHNSRAHRHLTGCANITLGVCAALAGPATEKSPHPAIKSR